MAGQLVDDSSIVPSVGPRGQVASGSLTNSLSLKANMPARSPIVAISDDLTGAVALAGEAHRGGGDVRVVSWDRAIARHRTTRALVVDTSSRLLSDAAAAARIADVLAVVAEADAMMYKRIDSYLRGPVSAELDAWISGLGGSLLVAVAAPAFGIATVDGVQLAGRRPVTETFEGQAADAPRTAVVADLLPLSTSIGLEIVRGPHLASALRDALARGHVVCDGETPSDLYRVARAASDVAEDGAMFSLVGSYGLAGAWLKARETGGLTVGPRGILVSSDSFKPATLEQLTAFSEAGGTLVVVDPAAAPPTDNEFAAWAAVLDSGSALALSSVDPRMPTFESTPEASRVIAHVTGQLLERAHPSGLIVIGGELASSLMRIVGCAQLEILVEPWPTSPIARFSGGSLDGTLGILKSGSRGDSWWLVHAVSLLNHLHEPRQVE